MCKGPLSSVHTRRNLVMLLVLVVKGLMFAFDAGKTGSGRNESRGEKNRLNCTQDHQGQLGSLS